MTENSLSTTESKYIALSQYMRDVLPLMQLLRDLKKVVPSDTSAPTVHYNTFEENMECIDIVETPHMRPRTKPIALKYYHFRSFVKNETVSIRYVEISLKCGDIFTKELNDVLCVNLR